VRLAWAAATCLAALLGAAPARAAVPDTTAAPGRFWMEVGDEGAWTRSDHLAHLGLSFTLGLGASLATDEPAAALSAFALGIAKEGLDSRRAGASRRDLVADALGAALALAVAAALLRPR
jgi:uncharacterized protein YfiM (DUF2279 family)